MQLGQRNAPKIKKKTKNMSVPKGRKGLTLHSTPGGAKTLGCARTHTHTHAWLRSCEMKVELLRRQRTSPGSLHLRLPPLTHAASFVFQASKARRAHTRRARAALGAGG